MISARTMNAEHSTMNLPQMRSIWLDEDEEAEKLYGLQAQQFMGSDDEECLGITYINSDKPLLSNKKNIELPPLLPKTHHPVTIGQVIPTPQRPGSLPLPVPARQSTTRVLLQAQLLEEEASRPSVGHKSQGYLHSVRFPTHFAC